MYVYVRARVFDSLRKLKLSTVRHERGMKILIFRSVIIVDLLFDLYVGEWLGKCRK